jgi:hypothetical protein
MVSIGTISLCHRKGCSRILVGGNTNARANQSIYLPNDNQLLNVHFVDDLTLTPKLTQHSVEGTMLCFDTFAEAIRPIVSVEKTKVFLISQENLPTS